MSDVWSKESLKDYVSCLIDDLDDIDYELLESKGRDFLTIRIEPSL